MLNIGIIGAGRIGKVHLESISYHVKGAAVTAIADPFMNDETKAFCESFGVEKIYTDYKKIIEDETIDAVSEAFYALYEEEDEEEDQLMATLRSTSILPADTDESDELIHLTLHSYRYQ